MFIYAVVSAFVFLLASGIGTEQPYLAAMLESGSASRGAFIGVAGAVFVGYISSHMIQIFADHLLGKRSTSASIQTSLLKSLAISMWLALLVVSGVSHGNINLHYWMPRDPISPTVHILSYIAGTIAAFWVFLTLINLIYEGLFRSKGVEN